MILKNKTAIVTGASDGLGREVVSKLGEQGVNLALVARRKEKLEDVKKHIKGVKVEVYPCDIRNLSEIKTTVNKISRDFKAVDILINNAGIWQKKMPIEEIEEQVVEDVIATNLIGLIHMTRLIVPILKKQKKAALINISSKSGINTPPTQSVYVAAKWGVRGFTEVVKEELRGTGIKVAGVYQAGVKTDLFFKTGEKFAPGVFENFMEPKDLADIIVFMLSQPPKIWLEEVRVNYK
ncbi:SDR family oxidoreductase [Candidatus Roizmanbacteria bacterium]|nr:SDR family oxidoreductase [Candidatus Roizmanbacteria bacterium]